MNKTFSVISPLSDDFWPIKPHAGIHWEQITGGKKICVTHKVNEVYLFTFWSWRPHGALWSLMALQRQTQDIISFTICLMAIHMQTITSPNVVLPHNRQYQVPPVEPFDQELPNGNKQCVFTTRQLDCSQTFLSKTVLSLQK